MNAPVEKLATDVSVLLTDVEELVKATAAQTGEKLTEVRNRVQHSAANVKPRLAQIQAEAREKAKTAVQTSDQYVHTHPWGAVGVAAGLGLVIGLLIGRR